MLVICFLIAVNWIALIYKHNPFIYMYHHYIHLLVLSLSLSLSLSCFCFIIDSFPFSPLPMKIHDFATFFTKIAVSYSSSSSSHLSFSLLCSLIPVICCDCFSLSLNLFLFWLVFYLMELVICGERGKSLRRFYPRYVGRSFVHGNWWFLFWWSFEFHYMLSHKYLLLVFSAIVDCLLFINMKLCSLLMKPKECEVVDELKMIMIKIIMEEVVSRYSL